MKEIKEAFDYVKNDILDIYYEINDLKNQISELNKKIIEFTLSKNLYPKYNFVYTFPIFLNNKYPCQFKFNYKINPIQNKEQITNTTDNQNITLHKEINSTDNTIFKPLNTQISQISIRNEGVKTNRQTDKQTNNLAVKDIESSYNLRENGVEALNEFTPIEEMDNTLNLLNSLDNLKKEIRLKFKRLTDQETLVFSAIYQLEEEFGHADYKSLSKRLKLTESSIRDYVRRLIFKKIPIEKVKVNNKEIKLNISPNLKKIITLNNILKLREI